MCGESEVKSLNLLKVLSLGNGKHLDFQFDCSFKSKDLSNCLIVSCKEKTPCSYKCISPFR